MLPCHLNAFITVRCMQACVCVCVCLCPSHCIAGTMRKLSSRTQRIAILMANTLKLNDAGSFSYCSRGNYIELFACTAACNRHSCCRAIDKVYAIQFVARDTTNSTAFFSPVRLFAVCVPRRRCLNAEIVRLMVWLERYVWKAVMPRC